MEIMLASNLKKPEPKFIWDLFYTGGSGVTIVRFDKDFVLSRLNSSNPPTSYYSLDTKVYQGSLSFTNNLGIYNERYIFSTKTNQPDRTQAWSATGYQSGNPTRNSYVLNVTGASYQTSTVAPNSLTARLYPGVTGTNGRTNAEGYIYGGLIGNVASDLMYKIDTVNGISLFNYTGPSGQLQSQAMCHHVSSGLWMFGGARGPTNASNTNDLFFMAEGTNAWVKMEPTGEVLPKVFNPGMAIHNGKIYIFCGIDGAGGNRKDTYIYDIATNNVSKMEGQFPGNSGNISHTFMYKNSIYSTTALGECYKMNL